MKQARPLFAILLACGLTACSLRYSPLPSGSSSSSSSAQSSSSTSEEPYIDPTASSDLSSSDSEDSISTEKSAPQPSSEQESEGSGPSFPSETSDSIADSGGSSDPVSEETSQPSEPSEESSSATSLPPVYDELADSLVGVDASDMSGLYEAFETPITNYTSTVKGYFNSTGLHDYYLNYQKNYVQNNVNLFLDEATYRYPSQDAYLGVLNEGHLNDDGHLYSFSLQGDTVEERLASKVAAGDLSLEKEGARYQDNLFTLEDLNETYFTTFGFTRISNNKYQYTRIYNSDIDYQVFNPFIDLCAPGLQNKGFYMTFSRVTIEIQPKAGVDLRLRLYASSTQWGKLVPEHHDTAYPNWNLLFSEAEISNIGSTEITPLSDLLKD